MEFSAELWSKFAKLFPIQMIGSFWKLVVVYRIDFDKIVNKAVDAQNLGITVNTQPYHVFKHGKPTKDDTV